MTRAISAFAALAVSAGAVLGMAQAHAEPDINCATGDPTGKDTSSPGFVRSYPAACVDKFLGLTRAENFSAPGGDTELVSLGKIGCHSLDLDADAFDGAAKAVLAAEPKLTFTFTSGADQSRDPGHELVELAMRGLCP